MGGLVGKAGAKSMAVSGRSASQELFLFNLPLGGRGGLVTLNMATQ